jgi:hypothetical protein
MGRFQIPAPFLFFCTSRCSRAFRFLVQALLACVMVACVMVTCVMVACVMIVGQFGTGCCAQTNSPAAGADEKVTARINELLQATWQEFDLAPSPQATDGEWCRRLFLDVIGRIPTVEEVRTFVTDRDRAKREKLVDQLLDGERYAAEYIDRWATIWSNVLIGRTGGRENNSLVNRSGLRVYLEAAFAANRRYDQFAAELIAATGSNRPDEPRFNGAVNFLTEKLADRAVQATARTAQVFMGVQIQCTQCHNHPFNAWKQDRFWQLNSFFRQTVPLRRYESGTRRIRAVELANQDFGGEGSTPEEAEVYYELRNGRLAAAYPVFLDGTSLTNRSGFIDDVNRREELAQLIVTSPYLPQALVNRYWSYFLGYGFTTPIDDMGPHNATAHQTLLEELAATFAEQEFDLKKLIRWIVLSQPYALSSRSGSRNDIDDPSRGNPPLFSRYYLRQLRPEELYRSLLVASYAKLTPELAAQHRPPRDRWLRQFVQALGNDEGDETTSFNGTIPQTLMMFNGPLMKTATAVRKDSFLAAVLANESLDFNKKLDRLYWAAVARKPNARERKVAAQLAMARAQPDSTWPRREQNRAPPTNPQRDALQDVWWALLNSNEFILNH